MPAARVERSGPARPPRPSTWWQRKQPGPLEWKKTRSPADGSAGPSRRASQASRSAAGCPSLGVESATAAASRLSTNSSDASVAAARRAEPLQVFRERRCPASSRSASRRNTAGRPSPAPASRSRWLSRHRPVPRSPRHEAAPGRFGPWPAWPRPRIAPAGGLWLRVRTASIATASSAEPRNRSQAIERQGRVIGPEHPQAAAQHGGEVFENRSEGDDVVFTGHLVPRIARLAVEQLQRRERRLEQIPRGRARAEPRQQSRRNCLEPMLTDPLDRREADRGIGIGQESPAGAPGPRADPSRGGSRAAPAADGREVLAPASAISSVDLERTPQSLTGRLLNERIIRFERLQKNILAAGSASRRMPRHGPGRGVATRRSPSNRSGRRQDRRPGHDVGRVVPSEGDRLVLRSPSRKRFERDRLPSRRSLRTAWSARRRDRWAFRSRQIRPLPCRVYDLSTQSLT